MVRPIQKNEKDDANFRYGDLGAGFMQSGSAGSADTGNGAFSGQSDGTGFVNAQDYLGANEGKGKALGDDLTQDVTGLTNDINSQTSGLRNLKTSSELPNSDSPIGDKIVFPNPNRSSADLFAEAEKYKNHPNAYKGENADQIDSRFNALEKLRMGDSGAKKEGAESLQKAFNPDDPTSRDLRERRLDVKAAKSGIGYGSGSRGFDAMFMEKESPDLFKSKYDALTKALQGYGGLKEIKDSKKIEATKSAADAMAFDDELAANFTRQGSLAYEGENPSTVGTTKKPGTSPVIDPAEQARRDALPGRAPDSSGGSQAPIDIEAATNPENAAQIGIPSGRRDTIPGWNPQQVQINSDDIIQEKRKIGRNTGLRNNRPTQNSL